MHGRSTAAAALALLAAIVILPASVVHAQQLEIHPRVGTELDDVERRYFNLFRQWPAGSITASRTVMDGVRFELSGSPEYSLVRPAEVIPALDMYIGEFEQLDNMVESLDWVALDGIARYAKRYFPRSPYTFVSLSGREQRATVIYADDENVWVSPMRDFDWQTADHSILRVDETRVARITRRRHWLAVMYRTAIAGVITVLPWRSPIRDAGTYDIGYYVGAAGTAYAGGRLALSPRRHIIAGQSWRFDLARVRIDRKEAFPSDFLAPELRLRIDGPGPDLFADDADPPVRWSPSWYVSLSSAFPGLPGNRSGYYATGFGLPEFEHETVAWTQIELGRDISERFSVSMEAQFALDPETGEPVLDYSGLITSALAEWYPWRPELHSFTRRFEVAVGAGPTLARLTSGTVIEWTPQITTLEPSLQGRDEFSQQATLAALQVRGRVAWAVVHNLSLTARASAWLPPFKLGGESFQVGPTTYYDIDDFSLKYGVSFGVVHRF